MQQVDVLIVGGGITGLATASFLKNRDWLLLEAGDELGGYCKTHIEDGFVWDYSGHFFHFRDPEMRDYMFKDIDSEVLEVEKITDIYYQGGIVDFPFQWNIDQLPKDEFLECLRSAYEVEHSETEYSSFKQMVKTSLGAAISDKFIIPYNEKLYACDLDMLDSNAMGRFFPKQLSFSELLAGLGKKNNNSYNNNFIYPVKGSQEFVKSLIKKINPNQIKTNSRIKTVDFESKLAYTDTEVYRYNDIVFTIPFNKVLSLEGKRADLSANKVLVFNLGFDKGTDIKTHWRYFPGDERFYRVGFYNNILQQERMSLYVEIGMQTEEEVDREAELKLVLQDLKRVGIIKDQQLTNSQAILMDPAYAHITGESERIKAVWRRTHANAYLAGRYAEWTYCSIEDNLLQAKDLASMLDI